jgi:hypothetical protein
MFVKYKKVSQLNKNQYFGWDKIKLGKHVDGILFQGKRKRGSIQKSQINESFCHNITEILLKVALNTIHHQKYIWNYPYRFSYAFQTIVQNFDFLKSPQDVNKI